MAAETGTMKIVILYEDEVRIAATALDTLRGLLEDEKASDEAKDEAWTTALRACMVALSGAQDMTATLMMARKSDLVRRGG